MHIFTVSYFFPNTIEEIDEFSGKDFEEFLFHFFTIMDLDPRITNDSDDKGVDLMIKRTPDSEKRVVGIQAKRWKGSVGPDEIRKMLDGKSHYNLEELWMITTSKLTSSARTTALNNHIKILNRDHVIEFLKELKKKDNIGFRPVKQKPNVKIIKEDKEKEDKPLDDNNNLVKSLKKLRIDLSKEHKLYPIFLVYNNSTLEDIVRVLPATLEELAQIKGLGPKKVELFGKDVLTLIDEYKKELVLPELELKIKSIRTRIMKFNNITNEAEVFTDAAIISLLKTKPKTLNELLAISGVAANGINIFGEYLIKKINEL